MLKPKFQTVKVAVSDGKSVCPVCAKTNIHLTGNHCGHLLKITAKGLAFYRVEYSLPPQN